MGSSAKGLVISLAMGLTLLYVVVASNIDVPVVETKSQLPDQQEKPIAVAAASATETKELQTKKASLGFIHAFFASLSVIVVSEIGDKTFFIAAIMAMKHSRFTIYVGAMMALGLMTLLSALLGNIVTKVIPKTYTYYASSFLFALFGLKMLREGYQMEAGDASDEYEEASSTLREQEEKSSASLEMGSGG